MATHSLLDLALNRCHSHEGLHLSSGTILEALLLVLAELVVTERLNAVREAVFDGSELHFHLHASHSLLHSWVLHSVFFSFQNKLLI